MTGDCTQVARLTAVGVLLLRLPRLLLDVHLAATGLSWDRAPRTLAYLAPITDEVSRRAGRGAPLHAADNGLIRLFAGERSGSSPGVCSPGPPSPPALRLLLERPALECPELDAITTISHCLVCLYSPK